MTSIYISVLVYFGFLLITGWRFRSLNKDLGNFVRGGGLGAWWLVGASLVISNVSAMTFTGMGSIAFQAGAVPLIAYGATAFASFVCFFGLAAWARQTEAYTVPDILRERFGPEVEQFNSYYSFLWGIQNGAVWLWALSIFCSAMFDLPANTMIVALGIIVALYSTMGGRWAVMGTDFLQSLIILPVSLIVFTLSLRAVGGVDGFIDYWHALVDRGSVFMFPAATAGEAQQYTPAYIAALVLNTLVFHLSFFSSHKFLSARDGTAARKAALFGGFAVIIGAVIWMVPAVVARFLYATEVLAHTEVSNPADTAYAITASHVLPGSLMGLMIIVLFAATMSNMDTGLNYTAGIFVRNILKPLRRKLGRHDPMTPAAEVRMGQVVTGINGGLMITLALIYANASSIGILELAYTGNVLIVFPLAIPILVGTWVKQLPRWAYFFSFACAVIPAAWSVVASTMGNPWSLQEKTFGVLAAGIGSILCTIPFYRHSSAAFRQRVDAFFLKTRTPIATGGPHETESARVGLLQRKILGSSVMWAGHVILLLMLVPSDWLGRGCVLFVSATLWAVAWMLRQKAPPPTS
ncbi:sodium:solute symporter family protein [Synoicihabitans lomoniglobus]|uniref:Uncharacterized protein n=1 Tax=Synoicihabitans lomoniglobus TaxID=2909285 RepID=A0AAE9ZY53_9BACT|nr:hypothetical protein [Opitutaceae bacterium LMO-M01]WED65155.1 hypothetical protein PXH66_22690 [Opitutaceae bacterium LMO-M01]